MTFTYSDANLTAGGTAQTVAALRLLLGDTTQNSGVLPGGANYSDEQLIYFASNGGSVAVLQALANTWGKLVDTTAGPLAKSYSQAARFWQKAADAALAQTGGGYATFRTGVTRQDGYAYRAGTVDVNP